MIKFVFTHIFNTSCVPQVMDGVLDPPVSVANITLKEHLYRPTSDRTHVNVKTETEVLTVAVG